MPSNVAEIIEVPAASAVANPCEPAALEIVATAGSDDAHVAWVVTSWVESSEYMAIAMNDSVWPAATLGLTGEIMIILRTAGVTVSTVEPVIPLSVALICDVPVATPDAMPTAPGVLEIVATDVVADDQVTWPVKTCVVLSE